MIFISVITFSGHGLAHTYYEGFSELSVNVVKQRIEIVHHFTTHDLEILLSEKYNQRVSADRANYSKFLKNYIKDTFSLSLNSKELKIKWAGLDNGISETVIYQTVEKEDKQQNVSLLNIIVKNQILIGFYPEQINRTNYKDNSVLNSPLFGTLIFNDNERIKKIQKNK